MSHLKIPPNKNLNQPYAGYLFVFQRFFVHGKLHAAGNHKSVLNNSDSLLNNKKGLRLFTPLGGIFRAEQNFSLSFLISSTREITR
jgi:hypothetical protein